MVADVWRMNGRRASWPHDQHHLDSSSRFLAFVRPNALIKTLKQMSSSLAELLFVKETPIFVNKLRSIERIDNILDRYITTPAMRKFPMNNTPAIVVTMATIEMKTEMYNRICLSNLVMGNANFARLQIIEALFLVGGQNLVQQPSIQGGSQETL